MLTLRQFYLTKLAEECQEVAQRAMKSMQFGTDEVQKDQEKTNAVRLRDEVEDLLTVITILEYKTEDLPMITKSERNSRAVEKILKILKYLKYSQELGMVEK